MSGVYWGLTALAILGSGLEDNNNDIVSQPSSVNTTDRTLIDWVISCQDSESGGYKSIHNFKITSRPLIYRILFPTVLVEIRIMILTFSIRLVQYKF